MPRPWSSAVALREERFFSLDEMAERLGTVLAASTADETELAWIEQRTGRVTTTGGGEAAVAARRTILVRVREGTRRGAFRTSATDEGVLVAAVRQAIAASRAAEPTAGEHRAAGVERDGEAPAPAPPRPAPPLWDPAIAGLAETAPRELLGHWLGTGDTTEHGRLDWALDRVVVATGAGIDCRAEATSVSLRVASGRGPGAGRASGSARAFERLAAPRIVERARRRAWASDERRPPPADPPVLLFSPEATAALVALLAVRALSVNGFETPGSPLAGMLGEHVFAPAVDLVDDGLDPEGLPFPFDLLGRPKRPITMIAAGVPRTPAIDERLAVRLQRPLTPHAVGPDDARPGHLFLRGTATDAEVLAAAEGGIFIPELARLECFHPGRVAVRAVVRGARRIAGGALAEGLAPMVWEDSLLRLFSQVRALGGEPVVTADPGAFGGVSAPSLAVEGAELLRARR